MNKKARDTIRRLEEKVSSLENTVKSLQEKSEIGSIYDEVCAMLVSDFRADDEQSDIIPGSRLDAYGILQEQ